jgi:hypothetical protein
MVRRTVGSTPIVMLGALALLLLGSCRRQPSPPELEETEWVIVDCHTDGIIRAWISKLSPLEDADLIKELNASIRTAEWRGPCSSGDYAFIVYKLKRGGIKAFNFVAWTGDQPELEIRPGYWSRTMPKILDKIRNEKVGWTRGDSLPLARIVGIQVWQYGNLVTGFLPHMPEFAPLASAATEVLKRIDPRACTFGGEQADPRYVAEHQPEPQFIVAFEKPLDLCKLIPYFKKGDGTVYVKYRNFRSSIAAIYLDHVAFLPDGGQKTWYAWVTWEVRRCFEHMGRPDPHEAFEKLLSLYQQAAGENP